MAHHRRGLRRYLKDDEFLATFDREGVAALEGRPRLAALHAYVTPLTLDPASMRPRHVEALRAAGFADEDVLAVCEVAAYYAYVNRIADGLGVELEPHVRDTP